MRRSVNAVAILAVAWLSAPAVAGDPPELAFKPAGKGLFSFDTGVVRGQLRSDGKNQGITSLVDVESGSELVHGPGALSFYRVFSRDIRYGDAARNWPTQNKLLSDGAVEVRFPPAEEHPLEMVAVFRWQSAHALDVETTITPRRAMPQCEVFLSSYFGRSMRGSVYVKPNFFERGEARLMTADVSPLVDGTYLMFPRDRQAVLTIFDGRWEFPPHPVQWSITRYIAGPLAVRRDDKGGVAVAVMAPPDDCFAVSLPYNKTPPDGPASHASLYLSLFGRDLAAGQTAKARTRMLVGREMSDRQVIDAYEAYTKNK